jgi:hypothetical protein
MDDRTRNDLLATLTEALKRETQARQRLQAHVANIEQVRAELGNPYFYAGRPADDPESKAQFTGYKSHEPAFALLQEWHNTSRQIAAIRKQLHDAGIEVSVPDHITGDSMFKVPVCVVCGQPVNRKKPHTAVKNKISKDVRFAHVECAVTRK